MVAVIKGAEVSDSALEVMQSYYDQLGCLETKIPFSQFSPVVSVSLNSSSESNPKAFFTNSFTDIVAVTVDF